MVHKLLGVHILRPRLMQTRLTFITKYHPRRKVVGILIKLDAFRYKSSSLLGCDQEKDCVEPW